jgi:hypothetical protein
VLIQECAVNNALLSSHASSLGSDERYLTQLCSGIILLRRCLHITTLTPVTAKSFADISSTAEPGDKRESNM